MAASSAERRAEALALCCRCTRTTHTGAANGSEGEVGEREGQGRCGSKRQGGVEGKIKKRNKNGGTWEWRFGGGIWRGIVTPQVIIKDKYLN
jgi:hypothetical protein